MTFWEHLDELRKVIFRSALAILVFMVIVFINKNFVFEHIIFAPRSSDFILYRWLTALAGSLHLPSLAPEPFEIELINIELTAQFFTHVNVSFALGLILSTPFILYQLWLFVKPALYEKEKKSVMSAFGWCSLLFFTGVIVGYLFVFPLTLNFLGNYHVTEWVRNQISLKSYIHLFTWLIIIMGLLFELPVLIRLLSRIGVVRRDWLKKHRKHAFVALLVLSAVITPSGDAFTLLMVMIPVYLLYECSIWVCYDIPDES